MRVIEGEAALGLLRKNRAFRWNFHRAESPPFHSRTRKAVLLPQVSKGFSIKVHDRIFTMGSCFARHVEANLERFGFKFATRNPQFFVNPSECSSASGFFNKFTTPSMLNEVLWASGEKTFPESGYFSDDEGRFYDGQMPASFASLERVKAVRESVRTVTRDIFSSDIAILTLGLVEAWHDNETNTYLNVAPSGGVIRRHPGRFDLHILDYSSSLKSLNTIYEIVQATNPHLRFVVTVSPVPLSATFTGKDIATANCYSKSVLRAVAEDFVSGKEGVDYFPSYEAVTESTPLGAWMEDAVHVRPELVSCVIRYFLQNYLSAEEAGAIGLDDALADFHRKFPEWSSAQ
ncbi:GSCFA domain-containing protein [Roseomonas sp. BN140053]|uniref:GSCFA domain-containing protein n=1 Tax=Roseomonas sp. BN140053 TaxID=3391898 RepID=UPI0039ED3702